VKTILFILAAVLVLNLAGCSKAAPTVPAKDDPAKVTQPVPTTDVKIVPTEATAPVPVAPAPIPVPVPATAPVKSVQAQMEAIQAASLELRKEVVALRKSIE